MLALSPGGGTPARIALATKYICAAIGDSNTFNTTYDTLPQYYPFLYQADLQGLSASVAVSNNGVSGNTTSQVLVRARLLPATLSGSIGVIYAGTNDLNNSPTVQASPTPTSTVFAVGSGLGALFNPQTSILVNGVSRIVQSVAGDTITLASALPSAPTAGTSAIIDTTQNLIDTASAMAALGYTHQIMGVHQYLNFSSGGDTLSAQQSLASTTRACQRAAITATGAITADFYNFMRNLIVNGTVVQGAWAAWHVADQNLHLNPYGQSLLEACIRSVTPDSWLASLRT